MTDLYDPLLRLSTVTGAAGDALAELKRRGEKIDDRVMHLYLDLVVAKLKAAAAIDGLAAARGRGVRFAQRLARATPKGQNR